jgi:hypothetical protein
MQGKQGDLREMYREWPFFTSTVDLIEMILAKGDLRIAHIYDARLVSAPPQQALGAAIRARFLATVQGVMQASASWRLFWRACRAPAHRGAPGCCRRLSWHPLPAPFLAPDIGACLGRHATAELVSSANGRLWLSCECRHVRVCICKSRRAPGCPACVTPGVLT